MITEAHPQRLGARADLVHQLGVALPIGERHRLGDRADPGARGIDRLDRMRRARDEIGHPHFLRGGELRFIFGRPGRASRNGTRSIRAPPRRRPCRNRRGRGPPIRGLDAPIADRLHLSEGAREILRQRVLDRPELEPRRQPQRRGLHRHERKQRGAGGQAGGAHEIAASEHPSLQRGSIGLVASLPWDRQAPPRRFAPRIDAMQATMTTLVKFAARRAPNRAAAFPAAAACITCRSARRWKGARMAGIRLGLVGVGKIARDQHLPAIAADPRFELVATASHDGAIEGVAAHRSVAALIAGGHALDAVSICTPPAGRHALAAAAIEAGLHVMLEKPPAATLSEIADLQARAAAKRVTLSPAGIRARRPGSRPRATGSRRGGSTSCASPGRKTSAAGIPGRSGSSCPAASACSIPRSTRCRS